MSFPRLIGIDAGDLSHKIYYLYNDDIFHSEPKDNSVFFRIDGKFTASYYGKSLFLAQQMSYCMQVSALNTGKMILVD